MNNFMKLPLRIVLPYVFFGSLWILFSDKALILFLRTQKNINLWSTGKGLFYVVITSMLLYWLIRVYARKVLEFQKALEQENNAGKLAQAALQESEELFHKMFSKHSAVMYLLDPVTLSIFDANESAVEFYGYTLNQFKKMKISNLNTLSEPEIRKIVDHAVKEDKNYYIFQHRLANGEIRMVEIRMTKILLTKREFLFAIVHDITKRKNTETALKASEAKFRTFFENSREALFLIHNNITVDCNPAATEMYGCGREELLNGNFMHLSPVFQPDASNSREKALKLFTKASMDKPQSFEWKQQRPDGSLFDAAILLNRFEMNGTPYLQASVRNITEQKLSDNIIRKSEEQYRRIVETAEEGIWLLNAQNSTTFVNSKLSRMLGYGPDEMLGCPFITFIDPLFHDEAEANLGKRQHGIGNQLEFKCRCKDGTDLWALFSTSLIFGKTGHYEGALVMVTDITDRKKTDDVLKETNEALKALILASPLAITVINRQKTVDLWSPAAEQLFGWSADEVLSKPLPIVPTDQIEFFQKMLVEEFEGRSRTGIELLRLCKDGSLIDVSLWSSPVRNSQGEIIATLGLYADMRSHKHLESQLIMAQKMEALGKVAGGVAHDFNNILTAIMGYAYMLQENLEDKQLIGHIEHINHAVERATGLTNSLLAFSRKKIISLKPIDVNATIRKSEKLLSRLIREDIEIITNLKDNKLTILGDDTQIDQVTMNLVTNARDAMPNGGTLTVSTDRFIMGPDFIAKHGYGKQAEYALITVSDTGIGMDEKTQESAFEPFFTTKDVGKGTGLGLSTVYGIVKQLDGYVTIESERNKGTTFKIYLPLIEEIREKISDKASTMPSRGEETILIGEDDPDVRKFVKSLLEGYGYHVIEACDGEDSVSKFKMNRDVIKLVVLDIIMPKKNGRDAHEEMRTYRPEIKTLFMSGYAGDVLNSKGIHEEGLNFIAKPLLPVEFLNKVRSVLDQEI